MWFSISLLPDGRQVAAGCVFVFTQLLSAVPGLLSAGASPCEGDSRLLVPRRTDPSCLRNCPTLLLPLLPASRYLLCSALPMQLLCAPPSTLLQDFSLHTSEETLLACAAPHSCYCPHTDTLLHCPNLPHSAMHMQSLCATPSYSFAGLQLTHFGRNPSCLR